MTEPGFVRRTRWSYDTAAADYAVWIRDELANKPLDRAVLAAFAELALATGLPVADLGCGTGRITAHLHQLGVPVHGIDISPGMITQARRTYPALRFGEGSMLAVDFDDNSLGGILAWYSIIHIPDEHLPTVFAEFHRTLTPGGYLQLAFQTGNEIDHRTRAGQHDIDLDFHRRTPEQVIEMLTAAGFDIQARLLREPDREGPYREDTPQAFLLTQKSSPLA